MPDEQQGASDHAAQVLAGERFEFGGNWKRFLAAVDDVRIQTAERSLQDMLGLSSLAGLRFVDAGSGSGLFSLAARRLGARVHSFDYDPQSVACTEELKRRYFPSDSLWTAEQGSVLEGGYLNRLGAFDIVYSWGVLHHTGAMWQAIDNVTRLVKEGGLLFISIYNDQGKTSRRWLTVKRAYNRLPPALRFLVLWPAFWKLWWRRMLKDLLRGRPLGSWKEYKRARGMSLWWDVVDWVGGYPFEVAKPEQVFDFCRQRGFVLERLSTQGWNLGCNEYVFRRQVPESPSAAMRSSAKVV